MQLNGQPGTHKKYVLFQINKLSKHVHAPVIYSKIVNSAGKGALL